MDATGIKCPACKNEIYRRSLSVLHNVRRRNVNNLRDRYICEQCQRTYKQDELPENDMKGRSALAGWSDGDD